jgi:hypothetical protein
LLGRKKENAMGNEIPGDKHIISKINLVLLVVCIISTTPIATEYQYSRLNGERI